ncbi:MAG TPA: alpha/beta hydrolase-fold protein [Solirubrobacteraceae bacterium]|nr:alpha/beta hydrolase-fold protein [Solirubrobacteraceae bacterium]
MSSAPAAAVPPSPTRAAADRGHTIEMAVASRPLHASVAVTLWSPPGAGDDEPLPALAVHDGPEYAERTRLTELARGWIADGRVPAHRIALLHPGAREEWYSASALYARALLTEVLPAVAAAAPAAGRPVGLGASLGALAMLHAQRRDPGAFAGLLLQSGSFFIPRHDHMEKGFARYGRIVRFVRGVLRDQEFDAAVPAVLTCGRDEDNVHNNRRVAAALALQGYGAALHERPGGHEWPVWADGVRAHLPGLLTAAWG